MKLQKRIILTLITIFVLMSMLFMTGCGDENASKNSEGILGTWYEAYGGSVDVVVFLENGTYYRTPEEYADDKDQDFQEYEYIEEDGKLILPTWDETATIILEEDYMEYTIVEYDEKHCLYRDKEEAIANDPSYYITDDFTDTIIDEDGFCIKDGVLYAYRGEAEEVVVPENVEVIYHEAFAGDFDHGVNLETVTVPGTVSEIKENAFAFTNADVIYIEEGVKTIGDYAFMDAYIDEVHFPASLTEIGTAIMETEEGLDGCKIYVPAGSAIDKYFTESMPYGDCELVRE